AWLRCGSCRWTAGCEREGSAAGTGDIWAVQNPPFTAKSLGGTGNPAVEEQILEIEAGYRACRPAVYAGNRTKPAHQRNLRRQGGAQGNDLPWRARADHRAVTVGGTKTRKLAHADVSARTWFAPARTRCWLGSCSARVASGR